MCLWQFNQSRYKLIINGYITFNGHPVLTCRIAFCVIRWLFVFHGWYRSTWPVLKIILNPFKIHKLINVNAFFYLPCLNIAFKITQRKFNSWRKQYKKSSLETKHNVKLIKGKGVHQMNLHSKKIKICIHKTHGTYFYMMKVFLLTQGLSI